MSDLLLELTKLGASGAGALVREGETGDVGAILVEGRRVCWARSADQRGRMTDLLLEHPSALSRPLLESMVKQCRERGEPLGERLVRENLVSPAAMRTALFKHTCEAIHRISRSATQTRWRWVEHRRRGYEASLTFSPAEVLSGVHAVEEPRMVAELTAQLRGLLFRDSQCGFVASAHGDLGPYAQVGCEGLSVEQLIDLATHARELMSLGAVGGVRGAAGDVDGLAYAVWRDGSYLNVVLDDQALGLNRLISQLANIHSR